MQTRKSLGNQYQSTVISAGKNKMAEDHEMAAKPEAASSPEAGGGSGGKEPKREQWTRAFDFLLACIGDAWISFFNFQVNV